VSKFVKIKPSETTVDGRFQRELEEARARAMSKSFDPNLVGVPVLSRREDGTMVRIDGQHRLAAAVMAGLGDVAILCEVHDGMSLADEARLFLRLNGGRSAVRVYDKFKARLVAKEVVAMAIVSILKGLGLKVTKSQQRHGVCAIKAVESVYHRGNLEQTMRVLTSWADGDASAYETQLVKAVSAFLAEYPDLVLAELGSKLQSNAPSKVTARLRRRQDETDSTPREAAVFVLREVYNERRKAGRLPMPGRAQLAVAS
jgi:hypothetical protein